MILRDCRRFLFLTKTGSMRKGRNHKWIVAKRLRKTAKVRALYPELVTYDFSALSWPVIIVDPLHLEQINSLTKTID